MAMVGPTAASTPKIAAIARKPDESSRIPRARVTKLRALNRDLRARSTRLPARPRGAGRVIVIGAFTHIVAVIVTAQCFGKGVELIGLSEQIGALVADSRSWLWPCAWS